MTGAATLARSFHVQAPRGVAVGVRPFLLDDEPRLAVIVKIGLELRHGQVAHVIAAPPITLSDVYEADKPAGDVVLASDLALRKPACDVTMVGDARAPEGKAAPVLSVRLAIYRGDRPLMKKAVVAMSATPEGIRLVPITYENTFGGPDVACNPIGSRAPIVQLARDAFQQPGCFAPVPAAWAVRRDRLDQATRAALASQLPAIRGSTDLGYFQAAPADQTIPFLLGDEWLVIDGVSASLPRVQTQLPRLDARAVLVDRSGSTLEAPLVWDTLAIDGNALQAAAVLRGDIASPLPFEQSTDLAVVVRLGADAKAHLPALKELFSDDNLVAALHRTPHVALGATAALSDMEHDSAARRAVAPYSVGGAGLDSKPHSAPPPGTPWSDQPAPRVAPAGRSTVPLREEDLRPPPGFEPGADSSSIRYPGNTWSASSPPFESRPAPSAPIAPPALLATPSPSAAPAQRALPAAPLSRIALAAASLRKSGMSEAALATFIRQLESEIGSDV